MSTIAAETPHAPDEARRKVARALALGKRRSIRVSLVLAVVTFATFGVGVSVGDFPIPLRNVVPAIFGFGDEAMAIVAHELRLPRAIAGVLVGAAFGLSGAIFQAVIRNPLASPDILGITYGGSAGAVFVITVGADGFVPNRVLEASFWLMFGAAFLGACVMALLIYGLAYRQGVSPYRFVLVGIGLAFVAAALIQFMLTRTDIYSAAIATLWLTGSLNAVGWESVYPTLIALGVLGVATLLLSGRLRILQLGDDAAYGLGVSVERARFMLVLVAVGLIGIGTAVAGPIAFVAFMAPPIARRLTRAPVTLVPAALVGALMVLLADLIGRRIFDATEIPVGVVTGMVGAPYLLWLLTQSNRVGRGG